MTEVVQSGMDEVPSSARDAVLARVTRLGAGAREVLDAAALIGTRVEIAAAGVGHGVPAVGGGRTPRVRAADRGRRGG